MTNESPRAAHAPTPAREPGSIRRAFGRIVGAGVCALLIIFMLQHGADTVRAQMSVDRGPIVASTLMSDLGIGLLGDVSWLLPAMLAVVVSLHIGLFGQALRGVDPALAVESRNRFSMLGQTIALVVFVIWGLILTATVMDPGLLPSTVAPSVLSMFIMVIGAQVGSFLFDTVEERVEIAQSSLELARSDLAHLRAKGVASRQPWQVIMLHVLVGGVIAAAIAFVPGRELTEALLMGAACAFVPLVGVYMGVTYFVSGRSIWARVGSGLVIVLTCAIAILIALVLGSSGLMLPAATFGGAFLITLLSSALRVHRVPSWAVARSLNGACRALALRSLEKRFDRASTEFEKSSRRFDEMNEGVSDLPAEVSRASWWRSLLSRRPASSSTDPST